ncbi:AraC family transcriptional regulator [Paenibacillus sp. FSL R5-0887]|uniref:AraC family transcriptional regulator n=1 Tax=Paenibacillus sp. FSL R5-0887 TaxID=2921662 RepID=UPI0030F7B80B
MKLLKLLNPGKQFVSKYANRWRKSFKSKVYMNFLSISIITVIIINVAAFQYFNVYMKNQINDMLRNKLENISTVYNSKLDQYRRLTELINKMPKSISYIYDYENTSVLDAIEISNNLHPILNANESVNSIFFFNQDDIIYELDDYYLNRNEKQNILKQVLQSKTDRYPIPITLADGSQRLVFFQTSRTALYGTSQSGIIIVSNTETLRKSILSSYEDQSDSILIVDNQTSQIITEQNNNYPIAPTTLNEIAHATDGYNSYSSKNKGKDEDIVISYVNNGHEGYSIVSVMDYQSSIEQLLKARNAIIIFSIFIIFIALLLSYVFTNKVYKPVNHMLLNIYTAFRNSEQDDEEEQEHGNHYDEIQTASLTISKALSKMSALESRHSSNEFIDFLQKRNYSQQNADPQLPRELKSLQEKLGDQGHYRVISVEVTAPSALDLDYNLLLLLQNVGQQIWSREIDYKAYPISSNQFILIVSEGRSGILLNDLQVMAQYAEQMIHKLAENYKVHITIGISQIAYNLQQLPDSYEQVQHLIRNKLFCYKQSYFIFDTFTPSSLSKGQANELTQKILELIKSNQLQTIPLENIEALLELVKNIEYEAGLSYLANLLADAAMLAHNSIVENKEYRSIYLDVYVKLQSCNNIDELSTLLKTMLDSACLELKTSRSLTVQNNIMKAIEYIHEHINDNTLSIDALAEKYNMSSSYFSKLFNSYTQKTFPDYINQLRLQRAAALLVEKKDFNINDIASEVGFNSSSYFAAAFKKKYGLSPSQYRINYLDVTAESAGE